MVKESSIMISNFDMPGNPSLRILCRIISSRPAWTTKLVKDWPGYIAKHSKKRILRRSPG
jgi:hypothetical protein